MTTTAAIPIPFHLQAMPMSKRGFLVPWFVKWINGEPDFRIMDAAKLYEAISRRLCWMCGVRLKREMPFVFVVGPMCVINCISTEPPSHPDCARYAAQVCPFLTRPHARRREDETTEQSTMPGIPILRNPGVCALAFTRGYEATPDRGGLILKFQTPFFVEWYAEGRRATRAEVEQSLEGGIPQLREINEWQGPECVKKFDKQLEKASHYLPKK